MNANAKYQYCNLRTRTAEFFRALLAVFMLATILTVPALAAQVYGPTGPTLMGSTIPIQWDPAISSSTTVNISLAGYGGSPLTLATNVSNSGHANINLPNTPSLPCNEPNRLYWIVVGNNTNSGWSEKFKLTCQAGTINVFKTAVNDSGAPILNGTFMVDVNCGHDGPNTTLTLSSANNFQASAMYIPSGRSCTINEQRPPAAAGCRWTSTYPLGQTVVMGYAGNVMTFRLEVHNQLNCLANGPLTANTAVIGHLAVFEGPLSIVKQVVNNNAGIPTPQGPFQVNVNCSPDVPNQTVSLTGPNFQQTVNVPNGSSCTINEIAPTPPTGCTWTTTYPRQTGKIGETLVVQNELKCGCPPGQTEVRFPWAPKPYCCDGKDGRVNPDKFCCYPERG